MKRLLLVFSLLLSINSLSLNAGASVSRSALIGSALLPRRDSFAVRAQIYYGDQDEEAVAVEADFYLLDRSVIEILKAAKFEPIFPDGKKHKITDDDYLAALAEAFSSEGVTDKKKREEEKATVAALINEALMKHQKYLARTNSDGRGFFKKLVPGKYHLFGIGETGDEIIVWNLPVEIAPGINSIELDQNNSAAVFPANH